MSGRLYVKNVRPVSFGSQGRARKANTYLKQIRSGMQGRSSVPASVTVARAKRDKLKRRDANYVDLASATYQFDTTGSITLIATVASGAGVTQRIGKKIAWKSVQLRGHLQNKNTATIHDAALLLVYDREPGAALPAITDILDTVSCRSFNKDDNSYRFRILRRWDFCLTGNNATPATGNEAITLDEFVDLKGLPGQFKSAGTGAIGDIQLGALYAVTVGMNAAGGTCSEGSIGYRVRYIDVEG